MSHNSSSRRGGSLPFSAHHRDPFDRLAQADIEGLTLVTRNRVVGRYAVGVIEA
ncbi:MAG: hypothetical protein ACREOC_02475 [Gemmatimonadales bacterium]